jgi:diguanylate cyclase (GGDEF)-like protein/PAS domain S-box-containing protein
LVDEGQVAETEEVGQMSPRALQVLLVEDNLGDARLLHEMFVEHGSPHAELTVVECMGDAEKYLTERDVDVVLLDLGLPDAQGLSAVRRARQAASRVPLVVLTGLDDESLAARALQNGAQDYLVKGQIDARGLLRSLRYAVERNTMEEALFQEKERAQVTLDSIGDAVMCTDMAGNVSFLNAVAEQVTGWSLRDAAGRPVAEVFRIRDARSHDVAPNPLAIAVERDRIGHLAPNCLLIRRDGSEIPIEDSVAPIHDRDGRTIGGVIVFRDVSAARALALRLTHAAQHDFLTGLPNRMLLNDRVSSAITLAHRHLTKVAVLFLDLDGFKHINDSLGHQVGDKLLQSIALRLVDCLRGSDTVCRQGGDEFVMLLSEVGQSADAATAAGRMLRAVAEAHFIDDHDLHITTSIGVSIFPDDGTDAETLIKNADTAMYQAKENGRHCFQFFKPAMNVRAVERQFIEEGLRRALERQEFALHYQPKVNLRTGEIAGVEALIRWMHPTRGLVPPAQFIPVAEDCGLILGIGRWVLREACAQAKAWADSGLWPITMAVNISGVQLRDEAFLAGVFETLADTGLDPRALELELTESVLMERAESTESILNTLRARGVQLAVDDFGTGYSSLSYLRKFSIDSIKIDQSFVRQISTAPEETTIVAAIISMGRSLKLRVVAEGVETLEELSFLSAHQCDEAQGYLFSRPLPASELAGLLLAHSSGQGFDVRPLAHAVSAQSCVGLHADCSPAAVDERSSGSYLRDRTRASG